MNTFGVIIAIAFVLVAIEGIFFLTCFRWLSAGKRQREKEFARLDQERIELLELQSSLVRDVQQAKQISEETLKKLTHVGAEAHAEWLEVSERVNAVLTEVEDRTRILLDENLTHVNKHRLALEKSCKDGELLVSKLGDSVIGARRLLRLFDQSVPSDEILKELQTDKYSEARKLLSNGIEASLVSKKLGLSMSEVALLSHMR